MISDVDSSYFIEGNPLIVDFDGIFVPYYAESIRKKGSTSFLVKIDGIDSEEEASEFVNKEIYILKKDAEELIEDELYDTDSFIGYEVIDSETGQLIGKIEEINDATTNVLFIIQSGEEEIYIPANDDFVVEINDEQKYIKMKLPEGLVEINSKEKAED